MTSTLPIDITAYSARFADYPADLKEFCASNSVKLPGIDSNRGQAIALMAQPENRGTRHADRTIANDFFKAIGSDTDDAIQAFNKAMGLTRAKCKRGQYCLAYPFEADTVDLDKRKGATLSGDKETAVSAVKEFWRKILVDVPTEEWQLGHLNPSIPDASENNLAWQPPIQARYRNRFNWDRNFHKMWPTVKELVSNMDEYYPTAEEKRLLYLALKENLGL